MDGPETRVGAIDNGPDHGRSEDALTEDYVNICGNRWKLNEAAESDNFYMPICLWSGEGKLASTA